MSFLGLEIAKRAMIAHRQAMDVSGHNIANAKTPGFSRQRVNLRTTTPIPSATGRDSAGLGQFGTGMEVANITRLRDLFLDKQYRDQATGLGSWATKEQVFGEIEQIFAEPSDTSIRTMIEQFWQSWQALANNPESLATRESVKQRALALVETLQSADRQLYELRQNLNASVQTKVSEINSLASQIAGVNERIAYALGAGQQPNDLMDERDLLLDKLSRLTNITVLDGMSGMARVLVGGQALVDGVNSHSLAVEADAANAGLWRVRWAGSAAAADVTDGELGAYLQLRDQILPSYQTQLNDLAWGLTTEVNAVHATGFDYNGAAAGDFFTVAPATAFTGEATTTADNTTYTIANAAKRLWDNTAPVTVYVNGVAVDPGVTPYTVSRLDGTITFAAPLAPGDVVTVSGSYLDQANFHISALAVAPAVAADSRTIATASQTGSPGDGSKALAVAQLRQRLMRDLGNVSPEDFYRALIGNLATESDAARRMSLTQQNLVDKIDNQRQSTAGVNLDEEMMDLMRYQHAFQAAARMVNVMDEMISTVVNRLGLGGR